MVEHLKRIGALLCDYCLWAAKESIRDTAGAGAVFNRQPLCAATLPTVLRYMNWEWLEAKVGVWAEAFLAGTPTPHAAVGLELLPQEVLKGGRR